jgi:hypothetical protein
MSIGQFGQMGGPRYNQGPTPPAGVTGTVAHSQGYSGAGAAAGVAMSQTWETMKGVVTGNVLNAAMETPGKLWDAYFNQGAYTPQAQAQAIGQQQPGAVPPGMPPVQQGYQPGYPPGYGPAPGYQMQPSGPGKGTMVAVVLAAVAIAFGAVYFAGNAKGKASSVMRYMNPLSWFGRIKRIANPEPDEDDDEEEDDEPTPARRPLLRNPRGGGLRITFNPALVEHGKR